ncbi:hypothetical protein GR183_09655 [Stappia sp. GBMRC 2046]|uniref:Carbonic anhydrase or acetyltransferase, isoleucine patch superfamily n=1 Tax=Stappia sediminis TaxID=2692190 RepID=A0A7X3S7V3_9HYPH|nr:hypothetical protein [Stappia sediminis]MXN65173.1 hypothetical protein [Stappia sediminis]
MLSDKEIARLDAVRRQFGFLEIGETAALIDRGTILFDPFSTLISRNIRLGHGNVIHPNVALECADAGTLELGDGNTLHSGTRIVAQAGDIVIGSHNHFGEGGFLAKVDRADASIKIGDRGRYISGASVMGNCRLGSGSQILGPIAVQDCVLGAGAPHTDPDPDFRGGVLKGQGRARGLTLAAGEVIFGNGVFSQGAVERQLAYHPHQP